MTKKQAVTATIRCATTLCAGLLVTSCEAPVQCKVVDVATLPVTYFNHFPVLTVQVDGKSERMILDTGAEVSFLTLEAIHHIGITKAFRKDLGLEGIGGAAAGNAVVVPDVKFDQVTVNGGSMGVMTNAPMENGRPAFDGVIGYNILQAFSIGLNLPDNQVTLRLSGGCEHEETPWLGDYAAVRNTSVLGPRATINVGIDHNVFTGIIDTGSHASVVIRSALKYTLVSPIATKESPERVAEGFGSDVVPLRLEQFDSMTLGAERFTDPWLLVADSKAKGLPDIIIGEDYLRHHRVYISNYTGTVYLGLTVPSERVD